MDPDRYPIAWQTKDGDPFTIGLGPLTVAVKNAFVKWVKQRVLTDAYGWMSTAEYRAFRQEVAAGGVFWNEGPCPAVAVALGMKDGTIQLNRLLFGDDVKGWSEEQLWDLLTAKDKDPASDYRIAFDLAWEGADPKAQAPTKGPTSSSGMPTSTPPTSSAEPTGTTGSSPS